MPINVSLIFDCNSSFEYAGGLAYMKKNQTFVIPYLVLLSICSILGVLGIHFCLLSTKKRYIRLYFYNFSIGNFLVIGSILRNKNLVNNSAFIMVLNMALSELFISMFVVPSIIAGLLLLNNLA